MFALALLGACATPAGPEARVELLPRVIADELGPRDDLGRPAYPDAASVEAQIVVTRIEAHRADGEWLVADNGAQLLRLNLVGSTSEASPIEARLPEGAYDQLRLLVGEASLVVDGGAVELQVPSGSLTGIKVEGPFCIDLPSEEALAATTAVLNFDLRSNLHATGEGKWILTPAAALEEGPSCDVSMD